jgi:hypothetical protein
MKILGHWIAVLTLLGALPGLAVTTVNPVNKYAYGANIGWVNAEGNVTDGLVVGEAFCSGYLYGANVGWIHMGDGTPTDGQAYGNASATDFGVNLEPDGDLRGFAYGANIGWVNFEAQGDPQVNLLTGELSGYAYGANVGWISLSNSTAFVQTDSLQPGPDTDGDMLPDAWELSYTNALPGLDGMDVNADADGDGSSDKEEYLAGTDPTDAGSALRITATALNTGTAENDVTWASVLTRLYRLELGSDLGNPASWSDSGLGDITPTSLSTTRTAPLGGPNQENFRVNAIRPLAP